MMARKLRMVLATDLTNINIAIGRLEDARYFIAQAGTPKTLAKVRSALKSAQGARRHADRCMRADR